MVNRKGERGLAYLKMPETSFNTTLALRPFVRKREKGDGSIKNLPATDG